MYDVRELTKTYHVGKVRIRALDGISITIPRGDMVAIMGRSGSGKSTLLRQLGLLDRPTSGQAFLELKEVTRLPKRSAPGFASAASATFFRNMRSWRS